MSQSSGHTVAGGVDLDAVAAAVRACPGVDDLDGGPVNAKLATYLPGRKIDGLKITDDTLTVQIRGMWDVPVAEVGAQIRHAVAHLAAARVVDIVVADLSPAPGYEPELELDLEPEPLSQPAIEQADAGHSSAAAPLLTPQPAEPPVTRVREPVVVERTVSVSQKVVADPAAIESADTIASTTSVATPLDTGRAVPEKKAEHKVEGEPAAWATNKATSTGEHTDGSLSVRTTPTPGETPKSS